MTRFWFPLLSGTRKHRMIQKCGGRKIELISTGIWATSILICWKAACGMENITSDIHDYFTSVNVCFRELKRTGRFPQDERGS